MSDTIEDVLEFHEAFGVHVEPAPFIPDGRRNTTLYVAAKLLREVRALLRAAAGEDARAGRVALIVEETAELAEALAARDPVETLDALVDLRYVCDGGVVEYGMADVFDRAFDRVHVSNMSKLDENGKPVLDSAGKIVKGPNYQPPSLRDLVE
jgi:predicted HAD superfamily Cof-like phosphohydrolase